MPLNPKSTQPKVSIPFVDTLVPTEQHVLNANMPCHQETTSHVNGVAGERRHGKSILPNPSIPMVIRFSNTNCMLSISALGVTIPM